MNIQLELQLLGIAGLLIHFLKDWVTQYEQEKKYKLTQSIPAVLLSIVTTSLLIYLKDSIADLYVITKFSAVVLGYFGNSVFFSFIIAKKPETSVALGDTITPDKPEGEGGVLDDGSKPPSGGRPDKP